MGMIHADKIGSELIFWDDQEKKYSYDFKDKKFYSYNVGKERREVKTINQFLVNTPIYEVDWIDKNYKEFITYIHRNERRCSNIGTFVKRLSSYLHLEAYFLLGFKIGDLNQIREPPEFYNKKVQKMLIKHSIPINYNIERGFKRNYNFLTDLFFCLDSLYEENQESRFFDGSELRDLIYRDGELNELVNEYRYDMKHLITYLCFLADYEALGTYDALRSLVDYARMMSSMQDKYPKYPRNLHTTHDIVVRNFNNAKKKYDNELFQRATQNHYKYEWKYKGYIIVTPKSTSDVQDEGCNLRHCVGGYIDRIIEKRTKILFLRNTDNQDESLVTLEVRGDKLVEARGFANRYATNEEKDILKKWCKIKNIEYKIRR